MVVHIMSHNRSSLNLVIGTEKHHVVSVNITTLHASAVDKIVYPYKQVNLVPENAIYFITYLSQKKNNMIRVCPVPYF